MTWQQRLIDGAIGDPVTNCRIWQRARNTRGYGVLYVEGKVVLAHRAAFYAKHGRWPTGGMVIDHVCNTKACVNPDHLRELENWQNLRRRFPAKSNPVEEAKRVRNRRSQAKIRGNYSINYTPERG